MKTKFKIGFRNKNQLPLFMIWKEFLNENNETIHAEIVFQVG